MKYRLRSINLKIRQGEKVALLGKSAAGKSSLISVINGTVSPTKGNVMIFGQDIKSLSRRVKADIGTIWQDLRLIEELNVLQNINAGILGRRSLIWAITNLLVNKEVENSSNCIKACGLEEVDLYKGINSLSGGQKQRVAIARLLRQNARFLLADEPLANLDPILTKEILFLLLNKNITRGVNVPNTSLIALHRPELIKYFDRAIGMLDGQIVFDKGSHEISDKDLSLIY